jgi:hypothetical protein
VPIFPPLDDEQVRRRSKDLFRNAYTLEVCALIERSDDRVNLTTLLGEEDLSPSLYSGPLRRLAGLGLLMDAGEPSDDRRERWYRPTESHLWLAARELTTP